ncbi:MAG: AmmeMemoRadiSam system protein B [Phycisphaerales bacterium]
MADQAPTTPPPFDPSAEHMQRPKLRKVRGFPVQGQGPDGKPVTLLGLADAQQISTQIVGANPAFQVVLPLMDGSRDLDQIVAEVGRGLTRQMMESFVAQLDGALLLEGPAFEALSADMRAKFDASDTLPPGSTAAFADALVQQAYEGKATEDQLKAEGGAKLDAILGQWMDQAAEQLKLAPAETMPKAIMVPHVDYPRGWINYASGWGRLRGLDAPDRIVILGTNHFGSATGVCGCDKAYESPLGTSPVDARLIETLKGKLGPEGAEKLFEHRFDHENEHSIELQIPWIQKVFGFGVPVFGALVHDPAVNNGESYDGNGLDLDPFVDAMKASLTELGGRTLVISSADLSHAGPSFGDKQPVASENDEDEQAKAFREQVAKHDQEMLAKVREGKPDDLVGAMAWQQNPTRWCSIGNIVAAMQVTESSEASVISYAAAVDPSGNALVSSASVAMT